MMSKPSLARRLINLGFVQRGHLAPKRCTEDPVKGYDFFCQDDGDGEYLAEWCSTKPFPFLDGPDITVDSPNAAVEVNAATDGPGEYPEVDVMAEEIERLRTENADLKDRLALADFPQPLPPDPSTKMSDYVPAEIRSLMEEGETFTQARKRLSELLNVELAELKNLRGMAGEDLAREADVERLLGLFARLGEI